MDTITPIMIEVDVFIVMDMEADSWHARPSPVAWCGSEEQALQFMRDNYHHTHHASDHFWWMEMERELDRSKSFNAEVVRDFTYFRIICKKISVPVNSIAESIYEYLNKS